MTTITTPTHAPAAKMSPVASHANKENASTMHRTGTAGILLDARGFVTLNERLEATAPHVWALGDCAGSPQFTHVAFDDFRVVRDNLAAAGGPLAIA
jgi:pyruvate/2-oxoglutarate dehydrogenase complex dihydrolipoamide dehydrogenase (E3) component